MLTLDVRSTGFEDAIKQLDMFGSKQMPFAIAKALTDTAKIVQAEVTTSLPSAFSVPTAFTQRAFTIRSARKTDLTAWVFAKDAQARYLAFGIQGGERRVKGFERRIDAMAGKTGVMLVPTKNIKKNASGDVSLATIKRIAGQANNKKYFIGTPKGRAPKRENYSFGVYERGRNGKLKALLIEADVKSYRERLDMMGIGQRVIRATFMRALEASMAYAMATARR